MGTPPTNAQPTNAALAGVLETIADYLSLEGASVYRIAAYQRAAESFREHPGSVAALATAGELQRLPGVGEAIETKVLEYLRTDSIELLTQMRARYPESVLELMHLPGVGPKTARRMFDTLGVVDIDDLRLAIDTGDLLKVPGFGAKSIERLAGIIVRQAARPDRSLLGTVDPQAEDLLARLRELPEVTAAESAGSLRRRRSTVRDIDLVAASIDAEALFDSFAAFGPVARVEQRGPTKLVARLQSDLMVDLRVVAPASFGDLLQHSTGSAAHNVALRALAQRRGFKVSEYQVEHSASGAIHTCTSEEEVYALLGLAWIPPELREDRGELQAADEGTLPNLLRLRDLRGDLHVHSDWSDGRATLEEMALAARERGLEYLCFSDHSQSLGVANGLTPDRVRAQTVAIRELDSRLDGITVLCGIEVDILADGSIDLPDDVLAELDVVTASIHSGFGQPQPQIQARLDAALENPNVHVIGHPSGRLLTRRPPYALDAEALIEGAVRTGTILEINAAFHRLDLSATHSRLARAAGALMAVSSDAHDPTGFDLLRYGVGEARRGWLEPCHVVNTRPLLGLRECLGRSSR